MTSLGNHRLACAGILFALLAAAPPVAARDRLLVHDRRSPMPERFELEPHLLLGRDAPGWGSGGGSGLGVRGSVTIAPDGFFSNVNDSVALGFGLDVLRYAGNGVWYGECRHFESGPNGTRICTDVDVYGGASTYVYVPLVLQWNVWLSERWSVFGEPGLDIFFVDGHGMGIRPALFAGGRLRIADRITLTARIGYPTFSFGVSFFL